MFVIESLCRPKQRKNAPFPGYNEDLVGRSGNVFWLLDGSSTSARLAGQRPPITGHDLVSRLDALLKTHAPAFADRPLVDLLAQCETVYDPLPSGEELRELRHSAPHTCVVLIRVAPDHVDYVLLQDASLLVRQPPRDEVLTLKDVRQDVFNRTHYEHLAQQLRSGEGFGGARFNATLDEMVDRERAHRNRSGGFWTFTGLPGASAQAVSGTIGFDPVRGVELLLASDGAARAWEVFGNEAPSKFSTPLSSLVDEVRAAERNDPEGARAPRVSQYDDFGALRIRVLPAEG